MKHHWSLAFGVTWENEQTASCYAHTSSVHQLICILLLLRQVPSVQACVEPGAKSSTDYVMLRLFICLQANCDSRAVKLFAISIYQMAWNKTSSNKAIWMLYIFQKYVELMATNQIIKKHCIFRITILSREKCKWRNPIKHWRWLWSPLVLVKLHSTAKIED